MLRFENISLNYGETTALSSINIDFKPNATTILLGPSGCGKSTILRLIAGLIETNNGVIFFEKSKLSPNNIIQLRHRMGYVIQEGGLFPHLSVRDNVILMARYLKWNSNKIESRLHELAKLVRITPELYNRYPAELSGGQRQRVSLMRALILDPDLLLLDEPLGALDPMIRFELQQELKEIFNRLGKTVVMVTHDIAEAAFFADHIILMREGEIIQKGTFTELVKTPSEEFVKQFINAQRSHLEILDEALSK
ncbi:MAG: ATP-binding cassette domain-containing protein [Thiohalomonadales bacterium]